MNPGGETHESAGGSSLGGSLPSSSSSSFTTPLSGIPQISPQAVGGRGVMTKHASVEAVGTALPASPFGRRQLAARRGSGGDQRTLLGSPTGAIMPGARCLVQGAVGAFSL